METLDENIRKKKIQKDLAALWDLEVISNLQM